MRRVIFIIFCQLMLLAVFSGVTYGQSSVEPVISFDFETEPDEEFFFIAEGTIEDGQLVFSLPDEEQIGEILVELPLVNYALEMDYTVISGDGIMYMAMREYFTDEGFSCRFEFTFLPIEGYVDTGIYPPDNDCSEWVYLEENSFDPIPQNQTVRVRMEVQDNTYRLLVDDVELISSDETTFTEGNTLFLILGSTEVIIDNIALYDLDLETETTIVAEPTETSSGGLFGDEDSNEGGLFANTDEASAEPTETSSGGLFGDEDSNEGGLFANTDEASAEPTEASSGGLFGDEDSNEGGLFANTDEASAEPTEASSGGLFGDTDSSSADTSEVSSPAETSPCIVSAPGNNAVGVYTGPALNRTIIRFLDEGDYTVEGQMPDSDGNVWYQLNKSEAVPGRENSINEVWIPARGLSTTGDCDLP